MLGCDVSDQWADSDDCAVFLSIYTKIAFRECFVICFNRNSSINYSIVIVPNYCLSYENS